MCEDFVILAIILIFCDLIFAIVCFLGKSTLRVPNYCDLIFVSQWLFAKFTKIEHTSKLVVIEYNI